MRIGYWGQDGQSGIESAVAQVREERGLTEETPWLVNYYPAEGPVGLVEFLLDPTEELAAFAAAHSENTAGEEENQPDGTLEEDTAEALEKASKEN